MTLSTAKLPAWQFKAIDPPGGVRFELVGGEIEISPGRNLHHAEAVAELLFILKSYVAHHKMGKVFAHT